MNRRTVKWLKRKDIRKASNPAHVLQETQPMPGGEFYQRKVGLQEEEDRFLEMLVWLLKTAFHPSPKALYNITGQGRIEQEVWADDWVSGTA